MNAQTQAYCSMTRTRLFLQARFSPATGSVAAPAPAPRRAAFHPAPTCRGTRARGRPSNSGRNARRAGAADKKYEEASLEAEPSTMAPRT